MAILMSINIQGSVGGGGANEMNDVRVVQQQLNGLMNPPRTHLAEDGKSGRKTEGAIRDFQRSVLKFNRPDGRVDPGGKTLRALNNPGSEGIWGKMSLMPDISDDPATPQGTTHKGSSSALFITTQAFKKHLNSQEKRQLDLILQKAKSRPSPQTDSGLAFFDQLAQESYVTVKRLLTAQGVVQYSIEVFEALDNLKRSGFSAADVMKMLKLRISNRRYTLDSWIQQCRALKGNPAAKRMLSYIGDRAAALGAVFAIFDSLPHFAKGDPGPGMAELYAGFVAYRVPMAGAMNAVATVLGDLQPHLKGSPYLYACLDLMRALDPITCGKAAFDLHWSNLRNIFSWIMSGQYPIHHVQDYVNRINASPLEFWNEGGKIWEEIFGF